MKRLIEKVKKGNKYYLTMENLDFEKMGGLIPVVVQDYKNSEVLMVGFMNKEAWQKTLETKKAHYYSRSRGKLWMKGEVSGNIQEVKEILTDCDKDTIVLKVDQNGGAACHTGYRSCFHKKIEEDGKIMALNREKIFDPKDVYNTNRSLKKKNVLVKIRLKKGNSTNDSQHFFSCGKIHINHCNHFKVYS